MRHRLLTGGVLALLAWPATVHAQSGGTSGSVPTGGAAYGVTAPRLVASRFTVAPRTISPGAPVSFRYRVDGTRQTRARAGRPGARRLAPARRTHPHGLEAHRPDADPQLDAAGGPALVRRLPRAAARRRPHGPHAEPQRHRLRALATHRRPLRAGARRRAGHLRARGRQRRLPGPGRIHLRRGLRRQPRQLPAPRPGHPRGRRHARRRAARRHRDLARLPGPRGRPVRRDPSRRRPGLRLHAPARRVDHRRQGRPGHRRAGVRAGRPDRSCDGPAPALRDLARRLVRVGRLAARRPASGSRRVGAAG